MVSDVEPESVRGFLGDVQSRYSLDINTVQRHLVSVKAFFTWAWEEGFVSSSPAARVRVKLVYRVVKGLPSDDVKRLVRAVQHGRGRFGVRNRVIVLLLIDCGLRVSELVSLELNDVGLDSGVLKVKGKGSKERLVPMGFGVRQALWKYLSCRDSSIPWLWVSDTGKRLNVTGVQMVVHKLGLSIGLKLHPHLLRHTFAIMFLRNGGGEFALQSILGHSSLEMTRRYCEAMGFEDVFKRHEVASPIDNVLKG